MKKIGLTVVVFAIMIGLYLYISPSLQNDEQGEVTVQIVNQIDETIIQDTISFSEDDTLFSLLEEHYDIGCANMQYQLTDTCEKLAFQSRVILKIDALETNWVDHYISIYVDDTYSTKGIDEIPLKDGSTYRFEFTIVGGDSN